MPPVMRDERPGTEPSARPHVVVKLKPGWTFNPGRRVFVSRDGMLVRPQPDLPNGSRIVPMAVDLARTPRAGLSAAEEELSRYYQIILPKGSDAAAVRTAASHWASIADASMPPRISLPGTGKLPGI
jgi:hypothetical protein